MARGGKRTPKNPAPASGPGRMSRRTDGGPADVPRYASPEGERPYGERKAVESQAAAAPMKTSPGTPRGGPAPAGGADPVAQVLQEGVFGPTRRPGEPPTAGAPVGPGPGPQAPVFPDDPNLLLRALVAEFGPHPDLMRLLRGQ